MNTTGIVIAIVVVGGVGLFIGVFLSIFGNMFKVETDLREDAIVEALPGNNCGGCGYAGCQGLASAIVKGEAPVSGCPVGGAPVAKEVAAIMGVTADNLARKVAFVKCSGTCQNTSNNYDYKGIDDCRMANVVPSGGPKSCDYGCMGLGSCKKVCEFGAISIVDGVAVVNKDKCRACGKCVSACPKGLIELIPANTKYFVSCASKDKGPRVNKVCSVGCIGCSLCVKECPKEAITVTDFLAHIDMEKCVGCGLCAKKCPRGIIRNPFD